MTAAQTKQHDEEKHAGIRKEKRRKVGSKAEKQENRTQGVHSNKTSRLCYKVEPGTLSHYLPYFFLLSSTAVSSVTTAAVEPPLREQINEKQTKLLGLGCSNSGSAY